jgi:FtsP/CotA-like multicopper oxidase with cupredoxin domain
MNLRQTLQPQLANIFCVIRYDTNWKPVLDCKKEFCECTHRLKVKLGEVIELVLVDEGKAMNNNHPMHLHGHSFRVVAMEKVNIFLAFCRY